MEPKNLCHLKNVASYFDITIEELCFGEAPRLPRPKALSQFQDEVYAGVFEVVLRRVGNKRGEE